MKNLNNDHFKHFLSYYNLQSKLSSTTPTTDNNTQIDIIFSNMNIVAGAYETYFSYHKPIFSIFKTF